MKKNGITFEELRGLLQELGCIETPEAKRTTFAHPALGTFLLFRSYAPKEIVSSRDMLVVHRQLIDNGLMEETEFDRFRHKATA